MGNRMEMRKASGKWDFVQKLHGQRQVGTHGNLVHKLTQGRLGTNSDFVHKQSLKDMKRV